MIDVLEEGGENAVQQEIRTFIAEMDEEEKADLIGLLRLGRGDGTMEEWDDTASRGLQRACRERRGLSAGRANARRLSRGKPVPISDFRVSNSRSAGSDEQIISSRALLFVPETW